MSAGVLPVGAGFDEHFLDPGSLWIGVAVDQPHDIRAISRELRADHELDGFARLNSEVIGIPDDAPFHEVVGNFAPNRQQDGRQNERERPTSVPGSRRTRKPRSYT